MKETVTFVSCRDESQAREIAGALVDEKLAACVSILPGIVSIYRWKNEIENAREVMLIIKSREELGAAMMLRIKALHSYEVPEILTLPVVAGNPPYLDWIREATT